MVHKTIGNIWIDKQVAPLEYCSIQRASALLKCEEEDFLHWHDIGAISLAIKLNNKTSANLYFISDKMLSDSEKKKVRIELNQLYNFESSRIIGSVDDIEITFSSSGRNGFRYNISPPCLIFGVWRILDDFNLSCSLGNAEKLYSMSVFQEQSISPTLLRVVVAMLEMAVAYDKRSLFVLRSDIENIYTHAMTGQPMPNFINGRIEKQNLPTEIKNLTETLDATP
ncbi:hypothetical protein Dpoa2040_000443 [Dickeya sp. CFBP 2040]|uniref:hypothetical protein n=1 Tax=Dickeya sp. CFBP 2040 TaxID=2718531 RepID=UPI0014459871|nr:hypothetical protein [Dickeya sp. CFBP 2040]NKI73257.1 hypothetical protein [Dickeya sp. CFBP 2040]